MTGPRTTIRQIECLRCNGVLFDYYGSCPACGRDREGLTKEDRMRHRGYNEIAGVHPVKRQRVRKSPSSPFDGEAKNIKWY